MSEEELEKRFIEKILKENERLKKVVEKQLQLIEKLEKRGKNDQIK